MIRDQGSGLWLPLRSQSQGPLSIDIDLEEHSSAGLVPTDAQVNHSLEVAGDVHEGHVPYIQVVAHIAHRIDVLGKLVASLNTSNNYLKKEYFLTPFLGGH